MAGYLIQSETLTNIADAIRSKTGSEDKLNPVEMVTAVEGIEVGSGGDTSVEDGLVSGGLIEFSNTRVTSLKSYAFYNQSSLTTVDCPSVIYIGSYAFSGCSALTTINFPEVTRIGASAFRNCSSLPYVNFPKLTNVGEDSFGRCSNLTTVDLPVLSIVKRAVFCDCISLTTVNMPSATNLQSIAFIRCSALATVSFPALSYIGQSVFMDCKNLMSVYLLGSSVPQLMNTNAFASTPMSDSTYTGSFGSIFVQPSMVDAFKAASNWSVYADRITAYEE